jgi:large subunit ribosomal protein L29
MKATELTSMSVEDLKKELAERQREQFNLRMQKGTGQLSRPDQVKAVRRAIARIKTVINQKRSAGSNS